MPHMRYQNVQDWEELEFFIAVAGIQLRLDIAINKYPAFFFALTLFID